MHVFDADNQIVAIQNDAAVSEAPVPVENVDVEEMHVAMEMNVVADDNVAVQYLNVAVGKGTFPPIEMRTSAVAGIVGGSEPPVIA